MLTVSERQTMIDRLRAFPAQLEALVIPLTESEIDAITIPGEWTVRQIVHHLADAHVNAFARVKLVLTLDRPHLQGYPQETYAELPDTFNTPIQASLDILRGVHARWANLLENVSETDWARVGLHSEYGEISLNQLLSTYAAHGQTHIDQINKVLAAGRA